MKKETEKEEKSQQQWPCTFTEGNSIQNAIEVDR